MKTLEQDLEEAVKFHGHLCGGQILGVRMALLALRELGGYPERRFPGETHANRPV